MGLAGCALSPPPLDAERQWREAIANLGMFAAWPASDDLMVGDIFLYVPEGKYFDLVRISAAPRPLLAEQFCWQERDRPSLDTITAEGRTAHDGRPAVTTDARRRNAGDNDCKKLAENLQRIAPFDHEVTGNHMTRLREAAVPTLSVGRFAEGEIAGGITSGNIGLALGFGRSAASAVRVELKGLQSATLEELRAARMIEEILISRYRRPDRHPNSLTPLMLARSLHNADRRNNTGLATLFCKGEFDSLDEAGARVLVANNVLYASGMTYDFLSSDVTSVRVALEFASALSGHLQAPRLVELPDRGNASGEKPPESPERQTDGQKQLDTEFARLMRTVNDMTLSVGGPGEARARLTTGRFGNLAMAATFRRPGAVGMGAALHYTVGEVAMPANRPQIEEALAWCGVVHGVADTTALEGRLQENLAWIRYLVATRDGMQPARPAARPAPTRPLRALPPLASIRMRL